MEKQPFLPIKFYPAKEWQEYIQISEYGKDWVLMKDYVDVTPAFQMVLPDEGRMWSADSFLLGTFEIVSYDDGTTYDIDTKSLQDPIVYRSSNGYRTLVWRRFPLFDDPFPEGRYYYHLVEAEGQTEWFSEVFELCDIGINALSEVYTGGFEGEVGFAAFSSTYQDAWRFADISFCKTGVAAHASAYMEFTAFLGEQFDLYISTADRTGACAAADWDEPVFMFLTSNDDVLASDIVRIDNNDSTYHFKLTAQIGGVLRLYMYIIDAHDTGADINVWLYRTHVDKHVQLRWFNDTNFCKIVYEELPEFAPTQYENIYFIDAKQVIDENSINENVVEDDEANKYRIIGTDQKWNSLKLVGSECVLNAMSLLRLHSNIQIVKGTGEVIDVVELLFEQSVIDYHASDMKLVYREESCSENNCGFEICCPSDYLPTMITVETLSASFPAAASYSGRYAMVFTVARVGVIYLSNGAAWGISTTYDVTGNCVAIQNHLGSDFSTYSVYGMQWSFFHFVGGQWSPVVQITSVADATGGIATVTIYADYRFGTNVWCQVEYYAGSEWVQSLPYAIDEESWTPVPERENLATATGARALSATSGAGTYWFRVHIWDGDCDLGYCPPVQQTIT